MTSLLGLTLTAGCAYRRFTTPLNPVPDSRVIPDSWPDGLYSFQILDAQIPASMLSGLPWDDDGSAADPFVRLYVDGRLLFQSEVQENARHPRWNIRLPRNVFIPPSADFRLELWDRDSTVSADPIGKLQRRGLPLAAARGARARLELGSRASLTIIAGDPQAHRGTGLSVELRTDALQVFAVDAHSPASRAGLLPGDRILAIGGQRVADIGPDRALGMLSLASERAHKLNIQRPTTGQIRDLTLDREYLWLVM